MSRESNIANHSPGVRAEEVASDEPYRKSACYFVICKMMILLISLRIMAEGFLISVSLSPSAISSVVERLLHTQEVTGSNPVSRTILFFMTHGYKRAACAVTKFV